MGLDTLRKLSFQRILIIAREPLECDTAVCKSLGCNFGFQQTVNNERLIDVLGLQSNAFVLNILSLDLFIQICNVRARNHFVISL